ncbi:hypothetical protein NECAME_17032, partial [Necator americanus]
MLLLAKATAQTMEDLKSIIHSSTRWLVHIEDLDFFFVAKKIVKTGVEPHLLIRRCLIQVVHIEDLDFFFVAKKIVKAGVGPHLLIRRCLIQVKASVKSVAENKSEADIHISEGFDKEEEKILKEFEFYHGFLPREDLFCLLKYVGEFLIRVSEVDNDPHQKGKREIILSVVCECAPSEVSRLSAPEKPIDEKEDEAQGKKGYEKKVRGKYPIKQQPWEYTHQDVQQGKLLGEGAFGEVRAGTLKLKSGRIVEVAIKV